MTPLLVALGAAVGAPLRFLLAHHLDGRFPHGTLLVNLTGSALLGFCVGRAVSGEALALVGAGFCGGLTTYSAFSVQVADARPVAGTLYAVVSVVLGVAATAVGFAAAQA